MSAIFAVCIVIVVGAVIGVIAEAGEQRRLRDMAADVKRRGRTQRRTA